MDFSVLGYEWEWWLTEALPGLAVIGTLALILFYTRLYRQNKEQTKALKASYAPSLDTQIKYKNNDATLEVHNRGQGAAKNITFEMHYQLDGRWTGFVIHFNTTLPPNHILEFNERQKVHFIPIVYKPEGVQNKRLSLKECIQDYDRVRFRHKITYTDILEDQEYQHILEDIGTGVEDGPLSETFNTYSSHLPKPLGDQRYAIINPSPLNIRCLISLKIDELKFLIQSKRPFLPVKWKENESGWYQLAVQESLYVDAVPYNPESKVKRDVKKEEKQT